MLQKIQAPQRNFFVSLRDTCVCVCVYLARASKGMHVCVSPRGFTLLALPCCCASPMTARTEKEKERALFVCGSLSKWYYRGFGAPLAAVRRIGLDLIVHSMLNRDTDHTLLYVHQQYMHVCEDGENEHVADKQSPKHNQEIRIEIPRVM